MNARVLELATRRGVLKARIEAQRASLAEHAQPLERALERGDAVMRGVNWLKQHPAAVGAAVAAAVVARPKRAWRWARRGLFLWRGWRAARAFLGSHLA